MNIKKIFKENKVVSEVSKIEQCSCVNGTDGGTQYTYKRRY